MWLQTKGGRHFSVVVDKLDATRLAVRTRNEDDAKFIASAIGLSDDRIIRTQKSDYHFRVVVTRRQLRKFINAQVNAIDYRNFKNTIHGWRHDVFSRAWSTFLRLEGKEQDRLGYNWKSDSAFKGFSSHKSNGEGNFTDTPFQDGEDHDLTTPIDGECRIDPQDDCVRVFVKNDGAAVIVDDIMGGDEMRIERAEWEAWELVDDVTVKPAPNNKRLKPVPPPVDPAKLSRYEHGKGWVQP
jgi:hypothetical protein